MGSVARMTWGLAITTGMAAALTLAVMAAEGGGTERVVSLVQDARNSPCFLAPTRAPGGPPPAAAVAAAFRGEAAGMLQVAESYLGEPGPEAARQAVAWLERAAAAGHPAAAGELGRAYAAGHGTPPDPEAAIAWWRRGAALGDARSMACLSAASLLGRGVEADPVEAARWSLLRDARTGGRGMLLPASADFERALPAGEMLKARALAMKDGAAFPVAGQGDWPAAAPAAPAAPAAEAAPAALLPGRGQAGQRALAEPAAAPAGVAAPAVAAAPGAAATPIWPAAWGGLPAAPPRPPAPRANGRARSGTGVVVAAPGVVLTASHVTKGCADIEVQAGLARFGGAELRVENSDLDLALLVVPGLDRPALPVSDTTRLGTEIVVLGFPGPGLPSDRPAVTLGNVSRFGSGTFEHLIQFTAPAQYGNSGGPLLDLQGRIVGIAVAVRDAWRDLLAGRNPPQNVNFAVAPGTVARFLADHGVPAAAAGPGSLAPDFATLAGRVERSIVRVVCHPPPRNIPRRAPEGGVEVSAPQPGR